MSLLFVKAVTTKTIFLMLPLSASATNIILFSCQPCLICTFHNLLTFFIVNTIHLQLEKCTVVHEHPRRDSDLSVYLHNPINLHRLPDEPLDFCLSTQHPEKIAQTAGMGLLISSAGHTCSVVHFHYSGSIKIDLIIALVDHMIPDKPDYSNEYTEDLLRRIT